MKIGKVLLGILLGVTTIIGAFILGIMLFPLFAPEIQNTTVQETTKTSQTKRTERSLTTTETTSPNDQQLVNQTTPQGQTQDPILEKALNTPATPLSAFSSDPYDWDLNQANITNGTAQSIGWIQAEDSTGRIEVEYHCFACDTNWSGRNYAYEWNGQTTTTKITPFTIVGIPCEHQKSLKNHGYIS
ncbi:hypothetical protein QJ527_03785 [Enterococcus mundtii]|uniref:hypothetical protein n=1 Tax=Enterococcus TaxID=1350 RepID=UPI00044F23B3|nr:MULTISPECIES: hypothetical protein [Enterococcus]EYT96528.1 hypothetical protein AK89_03065 [Enterococcus mundtii CRL35]MDA9428640.1 hypothetical protein [Enterococcus mundtii 1A]MDK4210663.1 hypothetical protein [Enterococcus mundtii]MDO7878081.1 hypothetical protein [Enterococcus mundtii]MEC3940366.1 hypothetical protein [Enterococcus mundtii]